MNRLLLRAALVVGLLAALLPSLAIGAETFLQGTTQLTYASQFSRAGEAYFSPDGDWFTRLQDPYADGRMGIE